LTEKKFKSITKGFWAASVGGRLTFPRGSLMNFERNPA
jgi:hypothetical protein